MPTKKPKGPIDHNQRRIARKLIADYARAHPDMTLGDLAKHFNRKQPYIRIACAENNVIPKRKKSTTVLVIVGKLLSGLSQAEVAREMGITRQYTSFVANMATAAGIKLPR